MQQIVRCQIALNVNICHDVHLVASTRHIITYRVVMGIRVSKRKASTEPQNSIIAHPTPGKTKSRHFCHWSMHVLVATDSPRKIQIIHFNDVYNIEPRDKEPVGGAARFKTAINSLGYSEPLVLFSGDALAPSSSTLSLYVHPSNNRLYMVYEYFGGAGKIWWSSNALFYTASDVLQHILASPIHIMCIVGNANMYTYMYVPST